MKTLFSLLLISILPLFSEIEYQIPQEWEVTNRIENKKGTTLIYTPKESTPGEFFAINTNHIPSNLEDTSPIEIGLTKAYPSMKITVDFLEKNSDSVIYEWTASEETKEKIHGWGRAFSSKEGTAILGYQTESIADVANARNLWLSVLKNASLKH